MRSSLQSERLPTQTPLICVLLQKFLFGASVVEKWCVYKRESVCLRPPIEISLRLFSSPDSGQVDRLRHPPRSGLSRPVRWRRQTLPSPVQSAELEHLHREAMDKLGLKRYCCRRMLLTHVDLIEKLL